MFVMLIFVTMIDFILENFDFVKIVAEFIVVILLFVFRGKSLSKADKTKLFEELDDMKYRLQSYQEKTSVAPQSFSNQKTEYVYNPADNTLVPAEEPVDLQQLVNSSADCSLDRILERFGVQEAMRLGSEANERIALLSEQREDLADLAEVMYELENARESFGLPLTASLSDIASSIKQRSDSLTVEIDKTKKLAQQAKEVSNGSQTQENKQESVSQNVSQNSEQSSSQKS